MVLGIQIAGVLFGLFMLYYSFLQYKRKEFSINEATFWFILWGVFVLVSLFPGLLDQIGKDLSFARTFDLLVTTGFLFLAGLFFYVYTKAKKNERQLEKVVREIALRKK
jgi:hypothetical protein